jgi:hypothetical protein
VPDESERADREWLLEPLAPNEVRIHVDVGEGQELSPEIRGLLDTLMSELHATEVQGFAVSCPDLSGCKEYSCNLGVCDPQTRFPCAWDEHCFIEKFRAR